MANSLKRKAVAYALRTRLNEKPELLVMRFHDVPDMPFRFPGGSVEPGEIPETGMARELLEEAGIKTFRLVRKLGIQHYFKSNYRVHVERHDYLIRVADETPDQFAHRVQGEGGDAGDTFVYCWITSDLVRELHDEYRDDLTAEYIPEWYGASPTSQGS